MKSQQNMLYRFKVVTPVCHIIFLQPNFKVFGTVTNNIPISLLQFLLLDLGQGLFCMSFLSLYLHFLFASLLSSTSEREKEHF